MFVSSVGILKLVGRGNVPTAEHGARLWKQSLVQVQVQERTVNQLISQSVNQFPCLQSLLKKPQEFRQ